jgi:hypothetical protein
MLCQSLDYLYSHSECDDAALSLNWQSINILHCQVECCGPAKYKTNFSAFILNSKIKMRNFKVFPKIRMLLTPDFRFVVSCQVVEVTP